MAKYRKKPVVVEATQWFKLGDHPAVEPTKYSDVAGKSVCPNCNHLYTDHGWVETLEGGHFVCVGDWIITGIAGEKYPCKDHIFKQTYENVED